LGPRVLLCALGVIAFADLLMWLSQPPLAAQAVLDEPAHAATGLVALSAFGVVFDLPVVLAALGGSLLIDLDHVPGLLGSHVLDHGTPRPYTHSLDTVLAMAAAAVLMRGRARKLVVVATPALVMHFFRDMAEPGGPGIALLWPVSERGYTIGYPCYAAALGMLATAALRLRLAPHRAK
jgi:hypothetical protein